jgi:hypothetical protein
MDDDRHDWQAVDLLLDELIVAGVAAEASR